MAQKIGRLKSLGVQSEWQAALLLPKGWTNLAEFDQRFPPDSGRTPEGESRCLVVRPLDEPKTVFGQQGAPRTTFRIQDADGRIGRATIWGDAREITARLKTGRRAALLGKLKYWNDEPQFQVGEWIDPRWLNHCRPNYPGKASVIGPAKVRERVIALLPEAIKEAAGRIAERLAALGDEAQLLRQVQADEHGSLEAVLWAAHLPDSLAEGHKAHQILERCAALDMLLTARENLRPGHVEPLALTRQSRDRRLAALPFDLTMEQRQAVEEIAEDLRRPVPMRRMLTGDVGTGKTAVYGSAVAMAADAGARVAVLLPNVALAAQVYHELTAWYPDQDIRLVSAGKTKGADKQAPVVVGTTALLSADVGHRDVLVVDEQQKFSRAQREQLADVHLLEVSATCIPRSQALVSFGVADISKLAHGHVDKQIVTQVRQPQDRGSLFADCRQTVEDGHQLAIVYPIRDADDPEQAGGIKSATAAFEAWEKHYPGRVRLVHGQMRDEEKQQALADMKADRADILVSTTVIEVGLTLPRLRHLLVVDAERYGLTTLHQLRGRVARHGGAGRFDLFLSREVPDEVTDRLRCLEQTDDGFELAEMDLKLRGFGDLAGTAQHGAAENALILGRSVSFDQMARVAETMIARHEKPAAAPWATAPTDPSDGPPSEPPAPAADDDEIMGDLLEGIAPKKKAAPAFARRLPPVPRHGVQLGFGF